MSEYINSSDINGVDTKISATGPHRPPIGKLTATPQNQPNYIGDVDDLPIKWYSRYRAIVVGQLILVFDQRGFFDDLKMCAEYTLGHGGTYKGKK